MDRKNGVEPRRRFDRVLRDHRSRVSNGLLETIGFDRRCGANPLHAYGGDGSRYRAPLGNASPAPPPRRGRRFGSRVIHAIVPGTTSSASTTTIALYECVARTTAPIARFERTNATPCAADAM